MSYDPENASEAVESKIKVHTVKGGGDQDKSDLTSCYFEQLGNPAEYALYEIGDDHVIPTTPSELRNGTNFQFIRGGVLWTVTDFHIDPLHARGRWFNTRDAAQDDGSFQAQAGPTFEEQDSAASVSA